MLIKPRSTKNGLPNISSGIFENYVEVEKNYSGFGFDYKYRIYNNQDCVLGMETRKRYRPSDMDNMLNVNKATNGENKLRVK